MSEIKIITNHHERHFLYGYELPESARKDFDYIDPEELDSHDFIKYRGGFYDPEEFTIIDKNAPKAFQQ